MNYLTLNHVTKAYGENVLFEDLGFSVNKGQKVAFVAQNGTGKSTLLRIICGQESSDGDHAEVRLHKDIRIGYLEQDPVFPDSITVLEAAFSMENPVMAIIRDYELALLHPEKPEALQKALEKMDVMKAWDYEVRIKQILSKLGINELEQLVETLSGGQQKRLALAGVLINEPDFLILDEPTNHLDLEMIEWLEDYLAASNLTLFMVTHDRYFLERVCNSIIELDQGKIYKYKGNYSYFLEKKNARQEQLSTEVYRAKSLLKYELDWIRRMPKARGTKAKARVDAFYTLKDKASRKVEENSLDIPIQYARLGGKILELHNVSKSYPPLVLLDSFSYKFKKNEKVGIVGVNGSGKTTLLKLMLGMEQPDTGKVVVGSTVEIGYYSQDGMQLKEDKRVIDVIRDVAEFIPGEKGKKISASMLLERFLFTRDQQYTLVRKLSGGEKRRLYLLTILMKNPNFLILDEPTNDLDILTLNVLEDFLLDFQGVLVMVSHDRYFMDKLVDHVFAFEGDGGIKDYPGNYSAYRSWKEDRESKDKLEAKESAIEKPKNDSHKNTDSGLNYEQKKELRRVEKSIEKLENKKAEITSKFNDPKLDHIELTSLTMELNEVNRLLSEKEDEWLLLSE